MARISIIGGPSNSGKSTSIKTLDPETTVIINGYNKPLPFRGSSKLYNREKRNLVYGNTHEKIREIMKDVSDNRPDIKRIVVDDAESSMVMENMERAIEKGYDKFTVIAQHMYFILNTAMGLREDLDVVFMFDSEEYQLDALTTAVKLKLPGMMIEERFNPQKICTVIAFTEVTFDEEENASYSFVVNKTPKYLMAKTPDGMFEDKRIPQDLNLFLTTVREYYDNEEN
jgi:hypothetical protein